MARSLAVLAEDADDLHLVTNVGKGANLPRPANARGEPELIPLEGNDGKKLVSAIGRWRSSPHETLLVVLDADADAAATYARVVAAFKAADIVIPAELPEAGLVQDLADERRVAVWIFPDNRRPGVMEDFVREALIPEADGLLTHTDAWVGTLLTNAAATPQAEPFARFAPKHAAKARLRTWLAAQARPGLPPGRALAERALVLDARTTPFVRWLARAVT